MSHEDEIQSLESQIHISKEYAYKLAKSKNVTICITHILTEKPGSSGKNADRPKYKELLYLVKTKQIDWIVAKELSRLSRSTKDFSELIDLCHRSNVSIRVPSFDIDLDSPMSVAMTHISSVFAQLERELIVQRTISGIRSLVISKQKIHGGPTLLGFKSDPNESGRWIVVEDEMEIVIGIFKTFQHYKSYKCTLDSLNKLEVKSKKGKSFNYQSLKRLLTNRKYIGKLRVPREDTEVDLPFGVVVPINLFNEVQATVHSIDNELSGKTRNPSSIYLLSGLLFTPSGNVLNGTSSTKEDGTQRLYYRCQKEDLTFACLEIESVILRAVEDICSYEGIKPYKEEVRRSNEESITSLKKAIQATTKEIERLKSLKFSSIDNLQLNASSILLNEIESRIATINTQVEELTGKCNDLSNELNELMKQEESVVSLENSIQQGEFDFKKFEDKKAVRGWLRGLFEKVVIDVPSKRIKIHWKHQLTNGVQLLPYKVEIPLGSRRQAIKANLDLNKDSIEASKLYELSVNKNMTSSQIAKELKVSRSTVSKYLKLHSIPRRELGYNRKRNRGVSFGEKILSDGRTIKITEEQKVLSAIRIWRQKGKTLQDIADNLNQLGTPTKSGTGQWHRKTIQQLLARQ